MPRVEKVETVDHLTDIFTRAKSVFVADYQGLNVEQMSRLRKKCREKNVHFLVVKNTLAKIAAQKTGYAEMEAYLKGPSAIAYSFEDPSAPARVIDEFAKETSKPQIKVSLFEGTFYGPDQVKRIASLPSRDVLLSMLVGGLNAPIQGLAGALGGILGKFVRTIDAVREKKATSG